MKCSTEETTQKQLISNHMLKSWYHQFFKSLTDVSENISYNVECGDESFDLEVAVPLGLMMNEAITNG